jgi:hypothetical protein
MLSKIPTAHSENKGHTSRLLESYDVPYPSSKDPEIRRLIWAKKEYRECTSGPKTFEDVRVSKKYFNIQVFFQRFLVPYKVCLLYYEPSSGKTGAYKCYQEYMTTERPGEVKKFYYFAGKAQINDFSEQVALNFGTSTTRQTFETAKGNIKKIHNIRRTLIRTNMKREGFETMTYGKFRVMVDKMSNEEIIKEFSSAALFIDEVQFIKLDDSKDASQTKQDRKRADIYKAFYRVSRLCPKCTFVISTGTPITNNVNDLIYQINLLPGDMLVETPVAVKIANDVEAKWGIKAPKKWIKLNLHTEDQSELEAELEPVLRGKVLYARAPETDAVKSYMTDSKIKSLGKNFPFYNVKEYDHETWREIEYDDDIHKYLTTYIMSMYQYNNYRKVHSVSTSVYAEARQASVFIFPTREFASLSLREQQQGNHDGIIGEEGFHYCCEIEEIDITDRIGTKGYTENRKITRTVKTWKAKDFFKEYVNNLYKVKNSGIKIYDIVMHFKNENTGPICAASSYVYQTCVLIGVILKVHGFEEYNPELTNIYDVDLLATDKRPRFAILGTKNKKSHQDILRVFNHKDNVRGEYIKGILITPVSSVGLNIYNVEHMFIIDPPFTPAALEQSEKRVFRPTSHLYSSIYMQKKYGTKIFPVYVYYCIAEIPPVKDENIRGTRDWTLYSSLYEKEKENSKVMHVIKRVAVDAKTNERRNIRESVKDFTAEADYLEADYLDDNAYLMDDGSEVPVDTSTYDSYYISKELNIPKHKIHAYLLSIKHNQSATIMDIVKGLNYEYTSTEILTLMKNLVEEQKIIGTDALGFDIVLNEDTGVFYTSRDYLNVTDRSLEYYSNFASIRSTKTLDSITTDYLDKKRLDKYKEDISTKEDYKDYIASKMPNVYKCKLLEDALLSMVNEDVEESESTGELWIKRILETLRLLYETIKTPFGEVIVHQVNSLYFGTGTNYNPVDSVLKAKQQLRILYYKSGNNKLTWSDCNEIEALQYSKQLNLLFATDLNDLYKKHADLGFIGIIVRPDAVHIRQFKIVKGKVESRRTGKNCEGFKLRALLPMLYKACGPHNKIESTGGTTTLATTKRNLINTIYSSMSALGVGEPIAKEALNKLDVSELKFYNKILQKRNSDTNYKPAMKLCLCLLKRGAIYNVIGDPLTTISRIRK